MAYSNQTKNNMVMYTGKLLRIRPKSFHHRIRDRVGRFIDHHQLLGIDPMDQSKFKNLYKRLAKKKTEES